MKIKILFVFAVFLLQSCASSYRSIEPEIFKLQNQSESNGVVVKWTQEVLELSGNRKYAKKELKSRIVLISLEIENNTEQGLEIGRNLHFYSEGKKLEIIKPSFAYSELKQNILWPYIVYSLGYAYTSRCNGNNCDTKYYPIGIPIFIGNLGVAANANKKFKKQLNAEYLIGKQIYPGEQLSGLIALRARYVDELQMVVE